MTGVTWTPTQIMRSHLQTMLLTGGRLKNFQYLNTPLNQQLSKYNDKENFKNSQSDSEENSFNDKEAFKILSDKNSDKVLGVHIIGHEAGNLVHEVATAMSFGGSAEDIARTCHGHPTLNEAVKEAALAAGTGAIHI